jgi:hypothetical protein
MTVGIERSIATLYELAFISALAGGALALGPLEESAWLLDRLDPARRLAVDGAMLFTGGLLGITAGTLLPAVCLTTLPISASSLALGSLIGLLHLAALGALLARTPLPSGLRPLALVMLTWLLPRALEAAELGPRRWLALCDLSRYWRAHTELDPASLPRSAAAIAALILAAVLLDRPVQAKALRIDPRAQAFGSRPLR